MSKQKRKKQVVFQVSDELDQRIEEAAEKLEKTKAAFIRDTVREKVDSLSQPTAQTV